MTTIAVDGKIFASDSQACDPESGCIELTPAQKIFQFRDCIVAVAGELSCQRKLVAWAKDLSDQSSPPEFKDGTEWEVLRCSAKGLEYHSSDANDWIASHPPAVLGSGGYYAEAGMICGLNASEAVRLAISKDCYSGGAVQVVKIPKFPTKLKSV